jgi:predicted aldo/keto reductase-like oxidoreductase
MLGIALNGFPRDNYQLMTKYTTPRPVYDAKATIDQFRKQCNTDYFDVLLLHRVIQLEWAKEFERAADDFSLAKEKGIVRAQGASVHGLKALRQFPGNKWVDVAMIRMNHNGTRMDAEDYNATIPGNVDEVVRHTRAVHSQGAGVISMKLVGEGRFTDPEDRQKALNFAMNLGCVDSVTIGFKSTAEIDEAITRMNRALSLG